ncbi:hypothetical protein, partial [Streptomyces lunaelactis]|uniref:hypothetical protein n=1 Tax=Streptomyces lunaelactis TaxID=1535768 RepID=UPI001C2FA3D3
MTPRPRDSNSPRAGQPPFPAVQLARAQAVDEVLHPLGGEQRVSRACGPAPTDLTAPTAPRRTAAAATHACLLFTFPHPP